MLCDIVAHVAHVAMKLFSNIKYSATLFVVLLQCNEFHSLFFCSKDVVKSVSDIVEGVVSKIPAAIPTPREYFQMKKNLLVGYPFVVAFRIVNTFCECE